MKTHTRVAALCVLFAVSLLPFLFCGKAVAGQDIAGYEYAADVIWDTEDLFDAATDTTLSSAIKIGMSQYFGVYYQAVSAGGSPKVTIEYMMCYTESGTYVIPDGAPAIVSELTGETAHIESIQPPPMPWIKFRVRGHSGNGTDTTILFAFFTQPPKRQ